MTEAQSPADDRISLRATLSEARETTALRRADPDQGVRAAATRALEQLEGGDDRQRVERPGLSGRLRRAAGTDVGPGDSRARGVNGLTRGDRAESDDAAVPAVSRSRSFAGRDLGWRWALLVAAGGFLARVALVWGLELAPSVERFEYEEVACNLLAGQGFGIVQHGAWYRTYPSAPFVLLTAAAHAAWPQPEALLLGLQALFIVPTTLAAYALARRLFGVGAGLLAAVGTAFHPGLLYFDTHKLHPLGFDAMLAVVGLLLAVRASSETDRGAVAGYAGLLHGLAILERTTFVALVPLTLVAARRANLRGGWVSTYILATALPLALWLGWTWRVYGEVVLNPVGAEVLWKGNNPAASGTNFARGADLVPVFEAAPEEFRREVSSADESGQRRAFQREALRFIRERPFDAAQLYLLKLRGFFWFSPHAGALYPRPFLSLYQAGYSLLALGACGGLVALRGRPLEPRRLGTALVVFFASVGVLQAAFYVETRHRWAVEPLLVVLAAGALAERLKWRRTAPLRPAAAGRGSPRG